MTVQLFNGDCLEVMRDIESGSIDAIITDPPYGTTACKWDSVIPFEPMWTELKRIIKPNGAIVLFGSQPFTSALIMSNLPMFKYCWVWEKSKATGHVHAKNKPMKTHEDVCVFSCGATIHKSQTVNRLQYNPQNLFTLESPKFRKSGGESESVMSLRPSHKDTMQTVSGYPKSIIKISSEGKTVHPTQKPLALLKYLIKTYTNENETVLDFTMGSGTTGHAAVNLNRSFIGIELDKDYYDIALKRIESAQNELINQFGAIT